MRGGGATQVGAGKGVIAFTCQSDWKLVAEAEPEASLKKFMLDAEKCYDGF